ncbi:flavin reductase family protein [Streptomyces sp. NPDC001635]
MTATPGLGASRLASPALLRSVFRRHAAGVAVVTAQGGGRPVGFTATSLSSVSAEPPLISFGIGVGGSSWPVMSEADHVGVHILGEHQEALAGVFATSGADRFGAPTGWREGPEGVPVLDGVLAWLVCRVVARVPAGDHRIVIAEVVSGDPSGAGRPLLYHQGQFNGLRD